MESDVFYNLVYGKKINGWEKFLLKYTPNYEESTDGELHWQAEIMTNTSQAARCSSFMISISTFNCPAGHTDPSCWDCSGCWNTDLFTFNDPCTFLTDFSDNVNGSYSGGSNATFSAAQSINRMLIHLGIPTLSSHQYTFLQNNSSIAANLRYWFSQNQNLEGANFLKWAVDFFIDNSTNGLSYITWTEFNNFIMTEQDYRDEMSISEKQIFDNLTYAQQMNYLMSAYQALNASQNIYGTQNCTLLNGKGDAFRHTYWNALCRRRLGLNITNQLTTAHEDKPLAYLYQNKEKEMDLYNNSIGMNLVYNQWATIYTIQEDIKTKLNAGNLRYISNLDVNCQATNNSTLIPTNQ